MPITSPIPANFQPPNAVIGANSGICEHRHRLGEEAQPENTTNGQIVWF